MEWERSEREEESKGLSYELISSGERGEAGEGKSREYLSTHLCVMVTTEGDQYEA